MQSTTRWFSAFAFTAAALALSACTNTPLYGNDNRGSAAPVSGYPSQAGYSQWGQVTNVELVRGERSSGTVGTIAGGVVGGLAGNQVGGGSGRTIATVAGAIGGALVGRAIEQNTRAPSEDYYRVTVRLENNTVRTFEYREPPNVREGERVRVEGEQLYR